MPKPTSKPTPPKAADLVRITVYVTPEEHRELKIEAATRGITLTALFMDAVYSRATVIRDQPKEEES